MLKTFSLVLSLGLLVVAAAGIDWFFGERIAPSIAPSMEGVVSGVNLDESRKERAEPPEDVPYTAEFDEAAAPQLLSASPVSAPPKPKIQITEADLPAPPQPAAVRALSEHAEYAQDQAGRLQALRAPEPSPAPAVVPLFAPAQKEHETARVGPELATAAELPSRQPESKTKPEHSAHHGVPHEPRVAPRPTRVATTRDSGARDIGARGPVQAEPPPQNIIKREVQRWRNCDGKWGKTGECLAYEHNSGGG